MVHSLKVIPISYALHCPPYEKCGSQTPNSIDQPLVVECYSTTPPEQDQVSRPLKHREETTAGN